MKEFIWILCIAVILHRSEGNNQGSRISALSPGLLSARSPRLSSCKNIFGPVCSDCSTLWTCLGGSTPLRGQECEKIYPGQPYCVDGGCSSSPDPNNNECSRSGITCTGTGYFPNPLNCSQYYFCQGAGGASQFYECPSGFVYNTLTTQCKRQIVASDCKTVNCTNCPDENIAYPGDPSLFAFCLITDGTVTPVVFKCLGSEQFVPLKHRCVFQCTKEGRIEDGRDCMKYYECYRNGASYIMQHQVCMTGFKFSSQENGCVVGTCDVDDSGSVGGEGGDDIIE